MIINNHHQCIKRYKYNSIDVRSDLMFSSVGDLSAEDPVHGLVYSPHAQPLSEPASVVLRLHAVRRRFTRPMEACRGH